MSEKIYDVFISYRRDKGALIARNLQQTFEAMGLRVFFDMEELTDGKFNENLYGAIEQTRNVIFLMTEGSLTRCVYEGDWVRKELEHVLSKGVNLIPIAPTGTPIEFPEDLPATLEPMKVLEVSELNLEKLFKVSVTKIAERLKDVVLANERDKKESEEAFLSQARRFKGNDGVIDAEEMKELIATAKELKISTARRIKLIEQVEQEFVSAETAGTELLPPMPEIVPSFDIFISYRRDGGAADARLMYERLTKDGYSVSFDMDTLKSGNFNEELLRRVAECKNFIILLSKGCFDRTLNGCKREDDWMRIELATALYNKKNVITVILPGFQFPAKLPPDVNAVRHKNGPKYDLYYMDSFYEKLERDFLVKPTAGNDETGQEEQVDNVDSDVKIRDESLDEIFGDDAEYWKEEAMVVYHSISRAQRFEELKSLDETWSEAEDMLQRGDHKIATQYYLRVIEMVSKLKGCSSPFITRLLGDGIDPHRVDWFEAALARAQAGDDIYQYGVGTLYAEGLGVEKDAASAFRWFERAANQGHAQALGAVGAAYSIGAGVEVDYRAARKFLKRAEKKGDTKALERLGYLYQYGLGVRKNYAVSVNYYKEAARRGNSAAMVALGEMLEAGVGIQKDMERALVWYRTALANGSAVAQRKMAEALFYGRGVDKDEKEAVKLVRLAAGQGDADAIALLGRAYEDGQGVDADREKALELYRKAAADGSVLGKTFLAELEAETQYRKGLQYLEGKVARQDFKEAWRWFEKAAEQGHASAMEQLGFSLQRGLGCNVDIAASKSWYERAAEKGSVAALVGLGQLYFRGYDGITTDYARARDYFKKAATCWRTVDLESQWKVLYAFFYLGRIYTEGLGVDKDYLLGQRCFLLGAHNGNLACGRTIAMSYEKGEGRWLKHQDRAKVWYGRCAHLVRENRIHFADDMAMRVVGLLYWYGDGGLQKDEEISRQWMLKAAKLGNVQCLETMGKAYLRGRGVQKDVKRGVELLEAAGFRGNADARYALGNLYKNGKFVPVDFQKAYEWFVKAAASGSNAAMAELYLFYREGLGVEKDDGEALKWLEAAVKAGNLWAKSVLGNCYEYGELGKEIDLQKAGQLYREAAAEGSNLRTRYEYGRCLLTGVCVEKNEDEAFRQLGFAVTLGRDSSKYYQKVVQLVLGLYFSGGCFSDRERWARGVDSDLNQKVLDVLARRLLLGDGVEKNVEKALECFKAAAERGNKAAQNSLGWMYYTGEFLERDVKKGYEWTKKAVENGNPYGMETLFRMYRDGDGVERNEQEALKWLELSANDSKEAGTASSELGECYEYGLLGKKVDLQTAYELYYRASQKSKCPGKYNRGRCHLYGIGTAVDGARAVEWLTKAAEKEDSDDHKYDLLAMDLLAKMYREGLGVEKDEAAAAVWQAKLDEARAARQEKYKGFVSPV